MCRCLTGSQADADDVARETFLRAFRSLRCTIGRAIIVSVAAIAIVTTPGLTAAPESEPSAGLLAVVAPNFAPGQWFQARLYVVGSRVVLFAAPDRHPVYTKILDARFETPPIARSGTVKLLQEEANNAIGAQWDDLIVRECSPDELAALDKAPPPNDAAALPDPRFAGGRILYQNDFSRPYFGTARPIGGAWRIHDGILECMDAKGWGVFDLGIEVSDCVLAFRFQRRNQPTTNWIGIAVRGGGDKGPSGQGPWIVIQERAKVILRAAGHRETIYLPDAPGAKQHVVFSVPSEGDQATTPRLAVLPVRNKSARVDAERLATLLGNRLMTTLATTRSVVVVARSEITPILAELSLAASGLLDEASAARAGKALAATHLLESALIDGDQTGFVWEIVLRRSRDLREIGSWKIEVAPDRPETALEQSAALVLGAVEQEKHPATAVSHSETKLLPSAASAKEKPPGSAIPFAFWPLPVPVPDFQPNRWYEFRLFVVGRRVVCFAAAEEYPLYAKIFDQTYDTRLAASGSIGLLQEEYEYSIGAKWDEIRVYECGPEALSAIDDPGQSDRLRAILDSSAQVGRLLYENSFDSPELGKEKPLVGTWRVVGGTLQNTDSGSGWSMLDLGVNVRDCLVCFRVLRGDNPTTNWVGISVRVDGPKPPGQGAFVRIVRRHLGQGFHAAILSVEGCPEQDYRPDPVNPGQRLIFAPSKQQMAKWGRRIGAMPPRQLDGSPDGVSVIQNAVGQIMDGLAQESAIDLITPAELRPLMGQLRIGGDGLLDSDSMKLAGKALLADAFLETIASRRGSTMTLQIVARTTHESKGVGRWTVTLSEEQTRASFADVASSIAAAISPVSIGGPAAASPRADGVPATAIVSFRNLSRSAELDPLQSGLADMLFAHLSAFPEARLVERSEIARVLREQTLSLSGLTEPDAIRVGSLVGARRLIFGEFTREGNEIEITGRVIEVETARVLTVATVRGKGEGFDPTLRELALKLAAELKLTQPAPANAMEKDSGIRTMEGSIYYARAMAAKHQGNWREAADEFARLALLEPRSSAWLHRYECLEGSGDREAMIQAGRDCLARTDLLAPLTQKQRYSIAYDCAWWLNRARRYQEALAFLEPLQDLPGEQGRQIRSLLYWVRQRRDGRSNQPAVGEIELDFSRSPGDVRRQLNEYFSRSSNRDGRRLQQILGVAWEASLKAPDDGWPAWFASAILWVPSHWQWGRSSLISEIELPFVIEFCLQLRQRWPQNASVRDEAAAVLARAYEKQERWKEKLDLLLELAAASQDDAKKDSPERWWTSVVKYWSGNRSLSLSDEKHMEYLREAAILCYKQLKDYELGRRLADQHIAEYGLNVSLVRYMAEQGHMPHFSSPVALLISPNYACGGAEPMRSAWRPLLLRLGFSIHGGGRGPPSDVALSQYDLVVCVGTGPMCFGWPEIERLRNYVARGGRLLLILGAPEQADPMAFCHRPLLRVFGLDQTLADRIAQVAATPAAGVANPSFSIQGAIPFAAPEDSVAYKCDRGAVVAVVDYDAGRLAVLTGSEWIRPDQLPQEKLAVLDQIAKRLLAPSPDERIRITAGIFRETDRRLAQALFRTANDVPQGWGPWYYYTRKHDPALLRDDLAAARQALNAINYGEFPGRLKAEATLALANFLYDHTTDSKSAVSLYQTIAKDYPVTPAAGFAWVRLIRDSLTPRGVIEAEAPLSLFSLFQKQLVKPSEVEFHAPASEKGAVFWAEAMYLRAVADWDAKRFDAVEATCRAIIETLPAGDPQRFNPALLLYMTLSRTGKDAEAKRFRLILEKFPAYFYGISELNPNPQRFVSGGFVLSLLNESDRMVKYLLKEKE
jgi:TolB-like protein